MFQLFGIALAAAVYLAISRATYILVDHKGWLEPEHSRYRNSGGYRNTENLNIVAALWWLSLPYFGIIHGVDELIGKLLEQDDA